MPPPSMLAHAGEAQRDLLWMPHDPETSARGLLGVDLAERLVDFEGKRGLPPVIVQRERLR